MDVAQSLIAVASLLEKSGKTDEAEATYRRAETLLAGMPGSRAARTALAGCRSRLGFLLSATGKVAEALRAYQLARVEQEAAVAAPGAAKEARLALAFTIHRIAILMMQLEDTTEVEAECRRAVGILQRLVDENPDIAEYRDDLVGIRQGLINRLIGMGNLREVQVEYRNTLVIARKLAEDFPAVNEFQARLSGCHLGYGLWLLETGKPLEAEVEYREALKIDQKLAADHPSVPGFRSRLANDHGNLAILLRQTGRSQDAEVEYGKALVIQQTLVDDHPNVTTFLARLALTHNNFGILLKKAGKLPEAEVEFRKALEIREQQYQNDPEYPEFQSRLADSLLSIGNLQKANVKIVDAAASYRRGLELMGRLAVSSPLYFYDLAVMRVQLAEIAGKPGSGLTAQEGRAEADRAMDELRRAVDGGFREFSAFQTDTDLDPLRHRDDFQALLMDFAMPENPFASPR